MADVKKKLTIKIKTPELTEEQAASVREWDIDIRLRWMGTGWEPKIEARMPPHKRKQRYPMADLLPGDGAEAEYTMTFDAEEGKTSG